MPAQVHAHGCVPGLALEAFDQGCRTGCACPPGEGSGNCCWAHWGWHDAGPPGAQAHRLQGPQAGDLHQAPQKHQRDQLDSRASTRAMPPRTPPVSWPLLAQLSRAFPLQEQSLAALRRAGGARGPQLGGDPVSADLLGAGLLLCLEGGQVNRQGTAGGDHRAGAALPGHGVQLSGTTAAMGDDCIRGCTSIRPLSPTQWRGRGPRSGCPFSGCGASLSRLPTLPVSDSSSSLGF